MIFTKILPGYVIINMNSGSDMKGGDIMDDINDALDIIEGLINLVGDFLFY